MGDTTMSSRPYGTCITVWARVLALQQRDGEAPRLARRAAHTVHSPIAVDSVMYSHIAAAHDPVERSDELVQSVGHAVEQQLPFGYA